MLAEKLALALLMGTTSDPDQAWADLREANRVTEVHRQADALDRYRSDEPGWAWPKEAPWSGFGSAR